MLRDDGPGGAVDPVSGDGLIYPEAFWGKSRDLDTEAMRASAAHLRGLGVQVWDRTCDVNAVWKELPGVYESPEAWRVYTLMDPAVSTADGVRDRFDQAAGHLETFAHELDFIAPKLADLEERANAFRARVMGGVEVWLSEAEPVVASAGGGLEDRRVVIGWREHTPTVEENRSLLGEYWGLVEQITMSADTCARALRILAGTQEWFTSGGGAGVGVITAEQLAAAGSLPFGAAAVEDRAWWESVGDGASGFLASLFEGAGMLVLGYNPETGDWFDGGAYGQAWGGLGNLAGSLLVLAPVGVVSVPLQAAGVDNAFTRWTNDRLDVVAGAGGSLIGYDHQGARAGGDGWAAWRQDPVATATTSALNIGTFFVPATAVGTGAKAGTLGAKVGAGAAAAAEVIVPGGSWLLKGGIGVARAGEATPTLITRGATVADTMALSKAGILTTLDNTNPAFTTNHPHPTGTPLGKPAKTVTDSSAHPWTPDNTRAIEADLHATFGENPYTAPDYTPHPRASVPNPGTVPQKTPAVIGASPLDTRHTTHPGHPTTTTTPARTGSNTGTGGHLDTTGHSGAEGSSGRGGAGGANGAGHGEGTGHLPEEPPPTGEGPDDTGEVFDTSDDLAPGSHGASSHDHLPALAQEKIAMYEAKIDAELAKPVPEYYMINRWRGNIFNWENYHRYETKEVILELIDPDTAQPIVNPETGKPRRPVLDSYTPGSEVVSRKRTQLALVNETTAREYINQAVRLYGPNKAGIRIADVPTTRAQLGHLPDAIGRPLKGELVLEVPVQRHPVPDSILRLAEERDVIIRDVNGKVYELDEGEF